MTHMLNQLFKLNCEKHKRLGEKTGRVPRINLSPYSDNTRVQNLSYITINNK